MTIFMSTHTLALAEEIATRIGIVNHGKLLCLGTLSDLRRELEALSRKIDFAWVSRATQGLDRLENRLKRNISRQLGLDALLLSLSNR